MSENKYHVTVIPDLRVVMRDGVELAVKITRPDAEGKFPGILEYNPYRRLAKALPNYQDEYPPVVPYLAERGYVVVQFEVRGTGSSGGWSTDIYSELERQDGYDMVEWVAAQSWCTGNVGMFGKSYGAVVQWQVAVQNPPHLKAIIVRSANDDVYTEWTNPGGVIRPYMFESYAPIMAAFNFAPPDIDLVGEKWTDIWNERLEHSIPWSIGFMEHQLDGPYWQERSLRPGYDRVKCPVFVIDGWADWYSTALLRAFSHLTVPKRALVGPWGHYYAEEKQALPGPRIDGRVEYLKWFDQWLKGIDTGVLNEPPITIFVRQYQPPAPIYIEDKGFWRHENHWPPDRTQNTAMYFQEDGKLSREPNMTNKESSDSYAYNPSVGVMAGRQGRGNISPWAMPLDQRLDEAYSLTYTTPPLEEDLEVTGNPTTILYVSSSADTAYFVAKLCDVAPDGTSKMVTDGGLNATHRSSHIKPEPLMPGKVYELTIELKSVAYVFAAGHRIRIDIASSDFQNAWPTPKPAVNVIHRTGTYPSRVIIPVMPEQSPRLPEPDLMPSPHELPKPQTIPKPEHSVTYDLIHQTVTSSFSNVSDTSTTAGFSSEPHIGVNRSSFTVSCNNPAEAVMKSSHLHVVNHPELEIKVEANCVTASDAASFRHLVQIEVSVNGRRHCEKSWSVSVPRELN